MKARGRAEEASVSFDYLNQLHSLHENWLIHRRQPCPAPVNPQITHIRLKFHKNYKFRAFLTLHFFAFLLISPELLRFWY